MADLEGPEQRRRRRGFRMTAKYQVTGWRFLYRRMQHALVRQDTRMLDDPQRHQAAPLMLGLALAVAMGVGAVALGLFNSSGPLDKATIVADKDSGALYVRVGDRLDPVTNLTSARLILGEATNPVRAKRSEIDKFAHGSLVGIPGAPVDIRDSADPWSVWTVCDTTRTGAAVPLDPVSGLPTTAASPVVTTAIGGQLSKDGDTELLEGRDARLVGYDGRTWLIYARPDSTVVRSIVDLTDSVVASALGLSDQDLILPISKGLFNAVPAEPPLVAPVIPGVGKRPGFALDRPLTVGTVLTSKELSGELSYYVTLEDGVQKVGLAAARMIRAANPQVSTDPVQVGADELAEFPKSTRLAVGFYPSEPVELIDATHVPVTCWSWSHFGDNPTANTEVIVGRTLPLTPTQIGSMTQMVSAASSKGATADEVYMPSTTGRFVQITGGALDSKNREGEFWVADNGVRFGLDTNTAATDKPAASPLAALNLRDPAPAPWAVISLFAPGPTLSQRDARIRHDGIPQNPVVAGISDSEMKKGDR